MVYISIATPFFKMVDTPAGAGQMMSYCQKVV